MTPEEHYEASERVLAIASEDLREPTGTPLDRIALRIAAAQVHATLATIHTPSLGAKR